MGRAYYNEVDPFAAAWLRNLIAAGHIAPGDVDERSIVDIRPADLKGYTQCHFFAGIGVWSYALRLAGWPDDAPVWTGSCPCPPFSSAGKGQQCPDCGSKRNLCHPRRTGYFICLDCGCNRHADARHLWPEFSRLIRGCRPPVVFGEQVASADGRLWLDVVSADLQHASYGVAGADLCAAGVGAPHIRQRLWWVAERMADADRGERHGVADGEGCERHRQEAGWQQGDGEFERGQPACRLGHDDDARLEGQRGGHKAASGRIGTVRSVAEAGEFGGLADADVDRQPPRRLPIRSGRQVETATEQSGVGEDGGPSPTNGHWRDADWLFCRDGKWRAVEPGTFPLAHGAAARVVRLRGYGNAIVAQAAEAFIESYLDTKAVALEVAA